MVDYVNERVKDMERKKQSRPFLKCMAWLAFYVSLLLILIRLGFGFAFLLILFVLCFVLFCFGFPDGFLGSFLGFLILKNGVEIFWEG